MSQKRFHISKDGKILTDRKNNTTITVVKFRIDSSKGVSCVLFNEGVEGKKQLRIARYTIDENEFNFGGVTPATGPREITTRDDDKVFFTKEELIELHQAHLEAANLTLRKLVAHIKANG